MCPSGDTSQSWTPVTFVAGSVAGAVGQLAGHPLDTIKVHAQTSSVQAVSLRMLYRGAAAPVATAGMVQSINLGLYENLRRQLGSIDQLASAPLLCHGLSGSAAGLAISFITCPLSRIKVAQQLTGAAFWPTARLSYKEGSLYTGWVPNAAFEASRGLYLVVYSLLKQSSRKWLMAAPSNVDEAHSPLPLWARSVAGAGANVVTWSIMYPVDLIRSVQQTASTATADRDDDARGHTRGTGRRRSALCCARDLYAEGGLCRLYRGFWPTILRAGPVAGIILPLIELILAQLEGCTPD
mmetsp:Transcript_19767/g.62930  ORF Transcript_19767/g.62930 Transcript_19767/m.62930 type:complete len:296 (+) Transcript_19767:52-939(+)